MKVHLSFSPSFSHSPSLSLSLYLSLSLRLPTSLPLSLTLSLSLPLSKHTHTHTHADRRGNNRYDRDRHIHPTSLVSQYLGWEWVGSGSLGMPSLGVDAFAEQSGSACRTRVQENTWGSQSTPAEACLYPHHFHLAREFGPLRWARLGNLDGMHGVLRPVSFPEGQHSRAGHLLWGALRRSCVGVEWSGLLLAGR